MKPRGGRLSDALLEAFTRESAGRERYELYATRADGHGYPQIARLFRLAALGDHLHAQRQLKAAGEVGGMEENLLRALETERESVESRYPRWEALAREEGDARAEKAFSYARGTDANRHLLLEEAAAVLERGEDLSEREYLVCKVCGYIEVGDRPPERCPVCDSPARAFFRPAV